MKTAITITLLALSSLTFAQVPNTTALKYYKAMDWIATTHVHTETFSVAKNDWIEIKVTCAGLADCGQPEYLLNGNFVKVPQFARWTAPGVHTEQVFGTNASSTGTITIYIPVIYGGVEYRGDVSVSTGPS